VENKFTKDNLIARWLDNRLNEDEKKELDASGELDALKAVLDDIDTWKVKEFDTEAGLKDLEKRKKLVISPARNLPKKPSINRWLSIAASVLILITGGYFSWNYFSNQPTIISTAIAENKTIELPSGSVVKIDASSEVSYSKKDWDKNRTIQLSGQAFFDVTKGSSFTVITPSGQIDVLGTQFNVKATDGEFEVKCYEGKVNVTYKKDEKILIKGQNVFAKESQLISGTHNSKNPEWMDGFSKYNSVKLLDVITDLEKYYETNITLPKKYENLQFTGVITHEDLNIALQTLFTSMEIQYILNEDNTVTVK